MRPFSIDTRQVYFLLLLVLFSLTYLVRIKATNEIPMADKMVVQTVIEVQPVSQIDIE